MGVGCDHTLAGDGFFLEHGVISGTRLQLLRDEAERLQSGSGKICVRDILQGSEIVARLAEELIPFAGAIPVRGILFDKTPDNNWPVPWHQDLSIAVAERVEVEGYSAWTVKGGVPHVQPPIELLEQMVTLRIHLDDTPAENGALRVVGGSHRSGRVGAARIAELVEEAEDGLVCGAEAGDTLLLKPLILHASGRSAGGAHRRVIHLEYALADSLSPALRWNEGVLAS